MKILYTAVATATGEGRNGHVRSSDGILEADLATPTELGGTGGKTNPEQLFAAGYSACFLNALKRMAGNAHVPITDAAVTAEVGMGRHPEDTGFVLAVTLVIEVGRPAERRTARRAGARGVPLLQRHQGQHRGDPGRGHRLTVTRPK